MTVAVGTALQSSDSHSKRKKLLITLKDKEGPLPQEKISEILTWLTTQSVRERAFATVEVSVLCFVDSQCCTFRVSHVLQTSLSQVPRTTSALSAPCIEAVRSLSNPTPPGAEDSNFFNIPIHEMYYQVNGVVFRPEHEVAAVATVLRPALVRCIFDD